MRNRILACVIPAMLLPTFASLVYYVWWAGTTGSSVVYTGTKLFTIVWPIVAVAAVERQRLRPSLRPPARHIAALPLGLLTGLIISGAVLIGYWLTPLGSYVSQHADEITTKATQMGLTTPARYIMFCVFLSAIHSLIEEFFWRWYVFGKLATLVRPIPAYLLAGLAFAGHHYVVLGSYFPPTGTIAFGTAVGIGGILWSWMLRHQQTLAGCWLSHALVDAAIFTIGYQLIFG